jgi:pyruvate/2-oxoglutarate dehydrogenase complex dihydrolipoamide acyltransferase (E2) component
MKSSGVRLFLWLAAFAAASGLAWAVYDRLQEDISSGPRRGGPKAAPVKAAVIERGAIELRRTFSGALEAPFRFVVAPKVGGRVARLHVDLADTVERGQVVAELDDDEYVQEVARAQADLAVAEANTVEAVNAVEIAGRALQRVETLRGRGVASESQFDGVKAEELAKQSRLVVARAEVTKAEAALLPKLDLFIALGGTGYAESFFGSVGEIGDGTYDVEAGIRFSQFIGNRSAKARERARHCLLPSPNVIFSPVRLLKSRRSSTTASPARNSTAPRGASSSGAGCNSPPPRRGEQATPAT